MRRLATVVACLAATAGLVAATAPATQADTTDANATHADPELLVRGRALYELSCVSCHGVDGGGLDAPNGQVRGPSLETAGEAGAYYQLSTGRMPLNDPTDLPTRKTPAYDADEIDALVAYVASLGDGPALPGVDTTRGDLAEGGVLYRENCQACHSATGSGGALSYGRAAPPLAAATPTQVGAAIRSGPGPMPQFGPDLLGVDDVDSIARYVEYLEEPEDRGGLALGRLGPIPEGFMIWVGGLGALLVGAFWMGKRRSAMPVVDPIPPGEAPAERPEQVSTEPAAVVPDTETDAGDGDP